MLARAPEYTRIRKMLEGLLMKFTNPSLNKQFDRELFVFFRKGVTSS